MCIISFCLLIVSYDQSFQFIYLPILSTAMEKRIELAYMYNFVYGSKSRAFLEGKLHN